MTTSPSTLVSSDPAEIRYSKGDLAYFQARLRNRVFRLIQTKFDDQTHHHGLTKAELGRRIGKRPEMITRLLSSPGNLTVATISDLLLGICGEELTAESAVPERAQTTHSADNKSRQVEPIWPVTNDLKQAFLNVVVKPIDWSWDADWNALLRYHQDTKPMNLVSAWEEALREQTLATSLPANDTAPSDDDLLSIANRGAVRMESEHSMPLMTFAGGQ